VRPRIGPVEHCEREEGENSDHNEEEHVFIIGQKVY
jgi:hypothetical protein